MVVYDYLSEKLIAKHTPTVLEKFYRTELRWEEVIIDNSDKTIASELGLPYWLVSLVIKYHLYEKYMAKSPTIRNEYKLTYKHEEMNKLEKFLKEKRLWKEFKKEFKNDINSDFTDYLDVTSDEEVILGAFSWDSTKKGFDFWNNIHNIWNSYIEI